VDYVGVFRNLQKALSIYAKPGQGNIEVPVKNKEQLLSDLQEPSINPRRIVCQAM
jgi:type I restriction enzyme R subunit